MRPFLISLLLSFGLPLVGGLPAPSTPVAPGPLVIVGGGGTTPEIQTEVVKLLGDAFRVAILPQASELEDRGKASVEMWKAAGATHIANLVDLAADEVRKEIERADLIWFPGGSQSRLVAALEAADLVNAIRERRRAGAVIGGTSAGAAAMGELMIEGAPAPAPLLKGAMKPKLGLGLWPEAVIDQHFVVRNRANRLLTTVLDHPQKLGVGIDERTCVIVEGGTLRVLGEGCVLIYDARAAQPQPGVQKGQAQGATGLGLHVLRTGMRFDWKRAG